MILIKKNIYLKLVMKKILNFLNLFNKKKSKDIENLLSIIPTKNSNPVVQDLIFEILTSKKKLIKV